MTNIKLIPKKPGVYLMRSSGGEIIYIGKAKNLQKRVAQYFKGTHGLQEGWKIPNLIALIGKIDYITAANERDALILERNLIRKYQPFFNKMWKDDKSYPFVKITVNEDYPRIFLTRKKTKDRAVYFGPYPNLSQIKKFLRYLWKAKFLPLRPCKWQFSVKKPLAETKINSCIYFHTLQCPAPCAGKITKTAYRNIAKRAVYVFKGEFKKLKSNFTAQMKLNSKKLNYEQSAKYRDLLQTLQYISEKVRVSRFKDEKLDEIIAKNKVFVRLAEILKLPKLPFHIEAFDTSHLFAKQSVGAMVCFIEAKKNHSHYRRFKIKFKPGDDFAMIHEIVKRRLKVLKFNKENMPDLILIDGGKPQLTAAVKAAKELKIKIPIIALAKKQEEIFTVGRKKSIKLSASNVGLKLLMQIRDEVHRFAVTYHRKLRNKQLRHVNN
jgi:excinuclease ABC subunit C